MERKVRKSAFGAKDASGNPVFTVRAVGGPALSAISTPASLVYVAAPVESRGNDAFLGEEEDNEAYQDGDVMEEAGAPMSYAQETALTVARIWPVLMAFMTSVTVLYTVSRFWLGFEVWGFGSITSDCLGLKQYRDQRVIHLDGYKYLNLHTCIPVYLYTCYSSGMMIKCFIHIDLCLILLSP